MFIDIAKIDLKAGKGGDGAVSFRREKYEPSGGPYGGDGGDGGSIIFVADENIRTLMDFRYKKHYKAQNGEDGKTKKQYGKKGADLIIKVPVGTLIKDFASDKVIVDLREKNQSFVIAKGGRGGRGNAKFATSIRQAPRFAEPGKKGQERTVKLELKLIADVGIIGLPNVGKSTLLSILSDAKPKIANYPFTTLEPNLGVVRIDDEKSYVIADIPGLIEGASKGVGLGFDFLKHIERTNLLVHVLDASASDGRNPIDDYNLIRQELLSYNPKIEGKKEIVVANKMDLPDAVYWYDRIREEFRGTDIQVLAVSAATLEGINELKYLIWQELSKEGHSYESFDQDYEMFEESGKEDFTITKLNDVYLIEGPFVDDLVYRTNFEDDESLKYFQTLLKQRGIIDVLMEKGIQEGDTVMIGDIEFEYLK